MERFQLSFKFQRIRKKKTSVVQTHKEKEPFCSISAVSKTFLIVAFTSIAALPYPQHQWKALSS